MPTPPGRVAVGPLLLLVLLGLQAPAGRASSRRSTLRKVAREAGQPSTGYGSLGPEGASGPALESVPGQKPIEWFNPDYPSWKPGNQRPSRFQSAQFKRRMRQESGEVIDGGEDDSRKPFEWFHPDYTNDPSVSSAGGFHPSAVTAGMFGGNDQAPHNAGSHRPAKTWGTPKTNLPGTP